MDENDVGIMLIICIIVIMFAGLLAKINSLDKECTLLKAKCVKVGVATYTVDVNSGIATFVFDIGEEK